MMTLSLKPATHLPGHPLYTSADAEAAENAKCGQNKSNTNKTINQPTAKRSVFFAGWPLVRCFPIAGTGGGYDQQHP